MKRDMIKNREATAFRPTILAKIPWAPIAVTKVLTT